MMKITHIINPVKVTEASDLFKAQPITFETMRKAKEFAKNDVSVNLISTQFEEDREIIPNYFAITPNLERSVLDFGDFKIKRKLPLIYDILKRAYDYDPSADYIIYTNVDIALMPHFYLFVQQKINEGFDAFVINRRTISEKYTLDTIYEAYSDFGKEHPGYDCFVFKRALFSKFILENIAIGAIFIGLVLFVNLKLNSKKFKEFGKEHLSFHIGNDQVWKNDLNNSFNEHNKIEFEKIKELLFGSFNNVDEVINSSFPSLNNNKIDLEPSWKKLLRKFLD